MRTYKCLSVNHFKNGDYSLIPIRDEDKYPIMEWRNEQIDILRQKEILTKAKQENYFKNVVDGLFEQEQPSQILWSFLYKDELIGYGGLVHIDWKSKNAEISFIICTERNRNIDVFKTDWFNYLKLITDIAKNIICFNKIYTYAYDIRDYYFEVMFEQKFNLEARLKKHIFIKEKLHDVLILSKIFETK